jgi:OOP family OmpA-OmpF porin
MPQPRLDQDKDGIPDSLDRCPTEVEIVNFYQDEDGCPDEKPDPPRSGPLFGLSFASGSETPESTGVLDSLAERLRLYPGVRLEIRGHTDDVEGPDKQVLSLGRAEFVRAFLDSLGIAPHRLETRGFADYDPMQPNRSGAARMRNRRVEIHVR